MWLVILKSRDNLLWCSQELQETLLGVGRDVPPGTEPIEEADFFGEKSTLLIRAWFYFTLP